MNSPVRRMQQVQGYVQGYPAAAVFQPAHGNVPEPATPTRAVVMAEAVLEQVADDPGAGPAPDLTELMRRFSALKIPGTSDSLVPVLSKFKFDATVAAVKLHMEESKLLEAEEAAEGEVQMVVRCAPPWEQMVFFMDARSATLDSVAAGEKQQDVFAVHSRAHVDVMVANGYTRVQALHPLPLCPLPLCPFILASSSPHAGDFPRQSPHASTEAACERGWQREQQQRDGSEAAVDDGDAFHRVEAGGRQCCGAGRACL